MISATSLTREQLEGWGRTIGARARPPLFLGLDGPLGAGKSVLARSIARGGGVEGTVPSPTYTLVQHHPLRGGRQLIHLDLYRLEHPDEVFDLGWDDLLADAAALVVVEWAERAGPHLPDDRWMVRLHPIAGAPERRRVEGTRYGAPPPLPPLPEADR